MNNESYLGGLGQGGALVALVIYVRQIKMMVFVFWHVRTIR